MTSRRSVRLDQAHPDKLPPSLARHRGIARARKSREMVINTVAIELCTYEYQDAHFQSTRHLDALVLHRPDAHLVRRSSLGAVS